ncbi:hypothetical protein ACIGCH_05605 [Pseudomonas helleri]|uniref:Uncharacterized protein n=2 Tax=Pseudomonas helleri TaxID=1608996 RepID=A0A6A7YYK1_9PSED|nr:hypothetical protein [Pseudomonas helleri]MQT26997.1 hypothetical protein [Pseudomonas helleri]MQT81928.1 hypothetical protein [Pseudomonas helleri]MQU17217.1 hypothetical protein [Pseudomonas helleri]MQU27939.1 hypothetical protein [Pseudomonas helleri]
MKKDLVMSGKIELVAPTLEEATNGRVQKSAFDNGVHVVVPYNPDTEVGDWLVVIIDTDSTPSETWHVVRAQVQSRLGNTVIPFPAKAFEAQGVNLHYVYEKDGSLSPKTSYEVTS